MKAFKIFWSRYGSLILWGAVNLLFLFTAAVMTMACNASLGYDWYSVVPDCVAGFYIYGSCYFWSSGMFFYKLLKPLFVKLDSALAKH